MRSQPVRQVPSPSVQVARKLHRGSAILAASVLLDSAVEHTRGGFYNPAMVTPIVTSLVALAGNLHGHGDRRARRHGVRDAVFAMTTATGVAGTGFHLYNTLKKPGGLRWQNLFYSGPLGCACGYCALRPVRPSRRTRQGHASRRRAKTLRAECRPRAQPRHRGQPARYIGRGRACCIFADHSKIPRCICR